MKRFFKVNIEISNVCNLACSFCPEVKRDKKIMDLPLFKKIIQEVTPITEQVCLHLMGEPILHPNLAEIVEICETSGAAIFLVTNGVLMKAAQAKILLSPAFRQINFSLHSFSNNFPDRDPSEYLQRIFEFTDRAMTARPDLYINFRLWNLQETRLSSNSNHDLLRRIQDHFHFESDLTFDVRQKKGFKIRDRLYLHFDTEFVWPSLDLPVIGKHGSCYGLRNHFGILADGTIVPCCLDKEGKIPLGNAQHQSITEVLAGERAEKILNGFLKRQLTEELCQRCQYVDRFKTEREKLEASHV